MDLLNNMYRVLCLVTFIAAVNGASISITEPHIIGGNVTSIEQYPYQAALLYFGIFNCGASILAPKYIVTAAHCFGEEISPHEYEVRVGSSNNEESGKVIELYSVFRHPKNTIGKLDFDVAVAVLRKAIKFTSNIQPIPLVQRNEEPKEGDLVTVSGWGFITTTRNTTNTLHAVTIPIVSREKCRDSSVTKLTLNMICAGSYGKTIYKGDSGGPLVNEKKQLVGLVSFSNVKNLLSVPGVYTNIANPAIHDFITKYAPENRGHRSE